MKRVNNENGYTLFLAVLIGVLFSIMAVSLITFTSSGINKNNVREDDQQAAELAEKGITHLISKINSELDEEIGEGILQDDFIVKLENTLKLYKCGNGNELDVSNVTGNYEVCIYDWDLKNEKATRKEVIVRSTGIVDDHEKEFFSVFDIGADSVPDMLNYTISTNGVSNGIDEGEGNLFLHGGVEIIGDVKADGNVIISNDGSSYLKVQFNTLVSKLKEVYEDFSQWVDTLLADEAHGTGLMKIIAPILSGVLQLLNSVLDIINQTIGFVFNLLDNIMGLIYDLEDKEDTNWQGSELPSIISNSNKKNAGLVLEAEGEVYKVKDPNALAYEEHINRKTFPDIFYTNVTTSLDDGFKISPKLTFRESITEKVEITEQRQNFQPSHEERKNYNTLKEIIINNYNEEKVFAPDNICFIDINVFLIGNIKICNNIDTYIFSGNNNFGKFATNRNLNITKGTTKVEESLFVGGNLYVGDMDNSNPSTKNKIKINGPIYVAGDLYISGANVEFNSLIYVEGKVNVLNSTINGLELDGEEGVLVVFAEGSINLIDNSFFKSNYPNNIRGYFYSNDKTELALKSSMEMNGGISGNRVIINSVPGAELKINYDPEVIETYSELSNKNQNENMIYVTDPPKLKERPYDLDGVTDF